MPIANLKKPSFLGNLTVIRAQLDLSLGRLGHTAGRKTVWLLFLGSSCRPKSAFCPTKGHSVAWPALRVDSLRLFSATAYCDLLAPRIIDQRSDVLDYSAERRLRPTGTSASKIRRDRTPRDISTVSY